MFGDEIVHLRLPRSLADRIKVIYHATLIGLDQRLLKFSGPLDVVEAAIEAAVRNSGNTTSHYQLELIAYLTVDDGSVPLLSSASSPQLH